MCKFTYTFPTSAYYSDNNEPSSFSLSPISEGSSQGQILLALPIWTPRWAAMAWRMGVPVINHPPKKQLLGCRGSQVPVPPLLSFSLPEAAPSPEVLGCCNRISPLLTALDSVFLGTALPKTLENRKQLKALLASFLASAPPFLSRNSLWIKWQYSLLKALGYNVKIWIARALFSVQKWQMFATGTAGKTHPRFLQREVKVQARFWVEIRIPVDHLLHILMTFKHNQTQLILEKQGAILSSRGWKCWAPLKSYSPFTEERAGESLQEIS